MIDEKELLNYHTTTKEILNRVMEDALFFLNKQLEDDDKEIARIYSSSRKSHRVKNYESLLRKVRRDRIENTVDIPTSIEDLLGIRISTPNKVQAKKLFEWFQSQKGSWFCSLSGEPKFTPYTIEAKNNYSLRTGYQAYHVVFVFDREYTPFTLNRSWSCELQIMSQVWEFWANYSRQYFYATSGSEVTKLLPYNAAISKILDSADDLMIATTDILLTPEQEVQELIDAETSNSSLTSQSEQNVELEKPTVTSEEVAVWLRENITDLIDKRAKIPNPVFTAKIADELNIYGINLERLGEILRDQVVLDKYKNLLQFNNISFLPVFQQILCMVLLNLDNDLQTVVDRVNSELWLLGLSLRIPS